MSEQRVIEIATGRTGTYRTGWMSGEPSVLWDDDPTPEFYYEGELELLEEGAHGSPEAI